jgi:hypothetical protein
MTARSTDEVEELTLRECPWCGQQLEMVESWAKSFDPPQLYREYHHRAQPECVLGKRAWTFPDTAEKARQSFIAAWNTRPESETLTVPPEGCLVLEQMSDEVGYSAATIASYVGLDERRVRKWQQALHTLGLAEFGTLHDLDGEGLRGRGYWLNDAGYKLRTALAKLSHGSVGHEK